MKRANGRKGKALLRRGFLLSLERMAEALEAGGWEDLLNPSDIAAALREAASDLEIYISINQRQQEALIHQDKVLRTIRRTPKIANLIARHDPKANRLLKQYLSNREGS